MKTRVLCVIAAVVFCLAVPVPALANSAGLPYLTILVENPPAGLELSLTVESEGTQKTYPSKGSGYCGRAATAFTTTSGAPGPRRALPSPPPFWKWTQGRRASPYPWSPRAFPSRGMW